MSRSASDSRLLTQRLVDYRAEFPRQPMAGAWRIDMENVMGCELRQHPRSLVKLARTIALLDQPRVSHDRKP